LFNEAGLAADACLHSKKNGRHMIVPAIGDGVEEAPAIIRSASNQKVKRAPPWNWRGELTVDVIAPKGLLPLE
jgi:hypothetical protein